MTDYLKQRLREAHYKNQIITSGNQTLDGDALDRIEQLEAERDELKADNARLREALEYSLQAWKYDGVCAEHWSIFAEADSVCDATPAQSLARIRNEVLEKCAKVCDEYADDPVYCGNAIRAMKEPE